MPRSRQQFFRIAIFREHIAYLVELFGRVVGLRHHQHIARFLFIFVQRIFSVIKLYENMGKPCHLVQGFKAINACEVNAKICVCGYLCVPLPAALSGTDSARWLS